MMKPNHLALGVLLMAIFASVALGQASNYTPPIDPTSVDQDFSRWCLVGPHHFTFEKTTLDDILRTVGSGRIERDGDATAATFQYFIRYRWKDQVVTFSSNNDMGGPTHVLEEVDISPTRKSANELRLPSLIGPIRFPFGEPGMSFEDLERHLGKTSLTHGQAEYQYPGKQFGKDTNGKPIEFDISGWMRVMVERGAIVELEISRITTN